MPDAVIIVSATMFVLFPHVYWWRHSIESRPLFVLASYGLPVVVMALFEGLFLPLRVFLILLAPQLDEFGY